MNLRLDNHPISYSKVVHMRTHRSDHARAFATKHDAVTSTK